MSDLPGMKRSHDDSTSPHPKRHNTEQSNFPHLSVTKEALKGLKEDLLRSLKNQGNMEEHEFLDVIYSHVQVAVFSISKEKRKGFVPREPFNKKISQEETQALLDIVRKAADDGASEEDLRAVVFHNVFWTDLSPRGRFTVRDLEADLSKSSQDEAIEGSWTMEFLDDAPIRGLVSHIKSQLQLGVSTDTVPPYAQYCSILQSSGMGKSRLLDEFSRRYFMIPINLRSPLSQGYPPADHEVRNFLTEANQVSQKVVSRMERFLIELFNKAAEILETTDWGEPQNKIERFRKYMSEGQSMDSAGPNRVTFYRDVVERADKPDDLPPSIDDLGRLALARLRKVLNCGTQNQIHASTNRDQFVDIFIAFDEAHTLSECLNSVQESHFVILRRILASYSNCPMFSFFLSTTGKVTQFALPRVQDASNRIKDGTLSTPRPYIFVGFDQLMKGYELFSPSSVPPTLSHVTSIEFAVRMGRPLWGSRYAKGNKAVRKAILQFAVQKLLCRTIPDDGKCNFDEAETYAILSQRLALDICTPQYLFDNANSFVSLNGVEIIRRQVQNHLRVCMGIGKGIESLRAIAPSEPILSEAACHIMLHPDFRILEALTTVLTGFNIRRGDRGELLVACFFNLARDNVIKLWLPRDEMRLCSFFSVNQLFENLFTASVNSTIRGSKPSLCSSTVDDKSFQEVFAKAQMHFNHVIKPQEQKLLTRRYLLLFMARGAAALGANCQPGFDAVYPFLYNSNDERLNVENVGFVIVQVKNDPSVSPSNDEVFKKMDPFGCSLLKDSDKVNERFPIPIIRLVFLIAKKEEKSTFLYKTYKSPSDGATSLGSDGRPLFTSYDYVCTGISPSILNVIKPSEAGQWGALAGEGNIFDGVSAPDVLRSQLPGCGSDVGHFRSWVHDDFFQESQ